MNYCRGEGGSISRHDLYLTVALLAGLASASRQDLREGKIKNGTICYLFFIGIIPPAADLAVLSGRHMTDAVPFLWMYISGILAASFPMLIVSLLYPGAFGGGDIKLMAVCGLLLGAEGILKAACTGLFLAGIYCAVYLAAGKLKRKSRLILGPFLSLGILYVWFLFLPNR